MKILLRGVPAIVPFLVAGVLAGCTSPAPGAGADGSAAPSSVATATTEEPAPDGSDQPAIAACEAVELRAEQTVSGQDLGDCVAAAMVAAGSGVQRVESSDGTSDVVHFRWDPDYSMSINGAEREVVVKGETGWVRFPGQGWVQADSSSADPAVVMATSIVELVRVFSDPRVLATGFATSDTWTVVGEENPPVDDADATTTYLLTPDTPMTVMDVALSDVELYLRPDHLGAYAVGTGTFAGISTTTSNTFTQWGGEVDIPDPTEE
ncbi:hypothetical protein [Myceligenerans pegani]|uniref:Lipoprotein n=1 Tax=Myceligenerans pegani TaxID=2776917 RepID=A0ABR9MRX4_9MICO|nr:hypothetical protein [Myceligenerans sp. TRM 65318]MBE1874138.1 hypothetical protein [Myceligenerans sp. TRM 65318]MBE3016410.1 hypothetical protein [Myceligenerans sp. TRM 65318]